uniref:Jerky putative n=1 Tax=Albugo laibachii Nc14 TaxID=890382 RepID=F0X0A4_9STRA|nr:jerky putative [Albugo laibachii Nc14]|eukprot:CCA27186.1 jerky putative [Albugo laibachii Nc14]
MVAKIVRVTTNIKQCQQIVAMAMKEPIWTHAALAKWATVQFKFGLPIDRTTIIEISSITGCRLKRSRTTSALFPEMEEELKCWIDKPNASEMSVTQSMVREEATRIARKQQTDLSSLTFSSGWLARFQARHCAKSGFDHDEAAIDYCIHSRVLDAKGLKKVQMMAQIEQKQIVTVLVATNANETDKLPLYFIGKAKKTKLFAGRPESHHRISYSASAKAWMRSDLFHSWLRAQDDVFRKQGRHVLLLIDNAPSHKTDGSN